MRISENRFHHDIYPELEKARAKFPNQSLFVTLAALTEEVGELNQTILQHQLEPEKGKTYQDIYQEAVQVAAMVIRVVFDCGLK